MTKFSAVLHLTGCFRYILGFRGNNYAHQFASVRKRRYFSRRQACIQSEVGPRKSSYGSGGALLYSSPAGSRAEPRPKSNI